MGQLPTVRIRNDNARNGYCQINECDFDPNKHEIYSDAKPDAVEVFDIDSMKKVEVVEMLEAHGVENPQGKVGELREVLRTIMFVEAG